MTIRILFVLMAIACAASAGQPSPTASFATIDPSITSTVSVFVVPDGSGKALTEARTIDGQVVDATITVTYNDVAGNPVFRYPGQDIWIETSLGGLSACLGGTVSDGDTNLSGQTTITGPFRAGGTSDAVGGEKAKAVINGTALVGYDLDILFNSPDLNGDLVVNLSDTIIFVGIYTGSYDYAADFSYDGVINLSDLVLYAGALNTACP
jgi:hypothetical protein